MKFFHTLIGAGLGLALACGAALAQGAGAQAQQQPPKPPETKTIGDWIVRCFPIQSPSPCDMYQELDDQRAHQRVLSFSIAFVPSLNRHGIQVTVPLEVSIPRGLIIQTDSFTSQPLKYRYCDRTGCFVQMPIDNATIEAMSKSGEQAKVRVFADNGKAYDIRFSLKGFAAAHDSMVEQAKAKAKPVQQQPAQAPAAQPAQGATP